MWRRRKNITSITTANHQEESEPALTENPAVTIPSPSQTNKSSNLADCSGLGREIHFRPGYPVANEYARFNCRQWEHKPYCLENTRVKILAQIRDWVEDSRHGQSIFWLNGLAGTGKSTIMRTIARDLAAEDHLAASFFFSRDSCYINRAEDFVLAIALQLSESSPELLGLINNVAEKNAGLRHKPLREQWELLLAQPLRVLENSISARHPCPKKVIIIDALDECASDSDIALILNLLSEFAELPCKNMRFVVSSRPETPFQTFKKMQTGTYRKLVLHHVNPATTKSDIYQFYVSKFKNSRLLHGLQEQWPGEESIRTLTERSGNLFLHAEETCEFILGKYAQPQKMLEEVLSQSHLSRFSTKNLDSAYSQILEASTSRNAYRQLVDQQQKNFRTTIGLTVTLYDPLSISSIATLSGNPDARSLLNLFASVLDIPESQSRPVQLIHPSFREYLYDYTRCTNTGFQLEFEVAHNLLAKRCLYVLSSGITKSNLDNFGWDASGANEVAKQLTESHLPSHIQYACRYWAFHIRAATRLFWYDSESIEMLKGLFSKQILYWIEALSLMQAVDQGIDGLSALKASAEEAGENMAEWSDMIEDTLRFMRNFKQVIELWPRQIYASALLLSPESCLVKQNFKSKIPEWVRGTQPALDDWGPEEMFLLEEPRRTVTTLAFSPDGKYLACGFYLDCVRIWNSVSGKLSGTLGSSENKAVRVQFSPDGSRLACCYGNGIMEMWETDTRKSCGVIVAKMDLNTSNLTFTLNRKHIIDLETPKKGLTVWDLPEAEMLEPPSGINTKHISIIDFSCDGKLILIFGLQERHLTLVSLETGKVQEIKISTNMCWEYNATSFSCHLDLAGYPDHTYEKGSKTMSWELKDTNPEAGQEDGPFKQLRISSYVAAFSPDLRYVVASGPDNAVNVYELPNAASSINIGLKDDIGTLSAFPSEPKNASGKFMRWNFRDSNPQILREEHDLSRRPDASAYMAAFSQDSKLVAISVPKAAVYVYDLASKKEKSHTVLEDKIVKQMCFSPGGETIIVAVDVNNEQMLIETATGEVRARFQPHISTTTALAVSLDGKTVATASQLEGIIMWNCTKLVGQVPDNRRTRVCDVVASPSKMIIATRAADGNVTLWNSENGQVMREVPGGTFFFSPCAISHDDRVVAIESKRVEDSEGYDQIVFIDIATGQMQSMIDICDSESRYGIGAADFSRDGKVFAWVAAPTLASKDPTHSVLYVQEIEVDEHWVRPVGERKVHKPNSTLGSCIAFTSDSKHIAFTPDNGATISLLDHATGAIISKPTARLPSAVFDRKNHPKLRDRLMFTDSLSRDERREILAQPGYHVDFDMNPWRREWPWISLQLSRKLLVPFDAVHMPYEWVVGDDFVAFPCPKSNGLRFIFLNDPNPQMAAPTGS